MTKIIEGETEATFMIRCIEEEQYNGRDIVDAAPICYYYWQSQNSIEIQSIKDDPELARNKYAAYLKGYNYKKP